MLAPALGRDITGTAFENFQERLLHAFARDVARDADVIGLAADLVDLVDVDNADLSPLYVVIGVLQKTENDVFHVLADIAGLGQRRGVGDAERDVEDFGKRFGEQRLARAGRSDQKDVAFLDLDISERIGLKSRGRIGRRRALQDTLEMIVHRHRKCLFRYFLTNNILVERTPDLRRLRHADGG